MLRTCIRHVLLASITAAATACAAPPAYGPAPATGPVRGAELRATGEANLFAALARARPDWLFLGGDTATAEGLSQVLVYVDRRHVGTLGELRAIPVGGVASVRMRSEQYVRATDPRHPRQPFSAALYVVRQGEAVEAPHRPWSLAVNASLELMEASRHVKAALENDRFGDPQRLGGEWFTNTGNPRGSALGATAHYLSRRGWGVEAAATHSMTAGWTAGLDTTERQAVTADVRATEGSLMATWSTAPLRVGIGPAYGVMRTEWAGGFCGCETPATVRTSSFGVAAGAAVTVPALSRMFVEVSVRFRHYPAQEAGPYAGAFEELDAGGTVASGGVGFGLRF